MLIELQEVPGLELCIGRRIVEEAGASIRLDSTPGKEAKFKITLPTADTQGLARISYIIFLSSSGESGGAVPGVQPGAMAA